MWLIVRIYRTYTQFFRHFARVIFRALKTLFIHKLPQTAHSPQRYNTSFTQNTGFFFVHDSYRCNLRTLGDSIFFPGSPFLSFSDVFFLAVRCVAATVFIVFGTKNPLLSVSARLCRAHAGCFLIIFFSSVAPGRVIYTGRARARARSPRRIKLSTIYPSAARRKNNKNRKSLR